METFKIIEEMETQIANMFKHTPVKDIKNSIDFTQGTLVNNLILKYIQKREKEDKN